MEVEEILELRKDLDVDRIDLYDAFDILLDAVDYLYDGDPFSKFGITLSNHFRSELAAIEKANDNPECATDEDVILEAMRIYLKDKDKTKKSPIKEKSTSRTLPPVILLASA